ncbi:MAG: DoxX family protein [Bacteroidota bacterium]
MKNSLDLSLLLLRITFGGLMLVNHGWGKMLKLFGDETIQFPDPIGVGEVPSLALAVFSEVLCAGLIVLGLLTRLATIPLIITMVIAAFVVHIGDPFPKMEGALTYLIPYIVLLLMGAGRYSLDAQLFNNKKWA